MLDAIYNLTIIKINVIVYFKYAINYKYRVIKIYYYKNVWKDLFFNIIYSDHSDQFY